MTDVVSPLTWKMTLDSGGFEVAAIRAGNVLGSLTERFDRSTAAAARAEHGFHKVGTSFKSVVVTLGALRFALMDLDDFLLSFPKSVARAGGEFERMQTLMEGLSKASDETVKKMEAARGVMSVIGISKTAPFEVKALSDAFVKFKTAGIDPTNGSLQSLVDSIAKFGGSSEQLKRASVAIQQMMGKNVISMEEMRQQLAEAVPNAMELMARGMGISIAELTDKISKGSVKSSAALARMFLQMQLDAAGAAEAMMKTMPGSLERLKTEYQLFQKVVANQGFLTTLTAAFGEITTMLESPVGQQFAKDLGVALREITESFILMGRWVLQNTELLKNLGMVLVSIYGGSKIAGMINGIRMRMRELADEQTRIARAGQAAAEKEIAQLQRVANAKERAIGQLDRKREAYEKRLEASRDSQVKSLDKQIAGETDKLQRLEKRRLDLLDQRSAAELKAVQKNAAAIEAARARIREGFSKVADLTDKKGTVTKDADAGLAARQKQLEDQRLSSIDKVNAKNVAALEQLRVLEQRRDDAVAAHKQAGADRLARLTELRADREAALARKMAGAQERLIQLEEKRTRLIEGTRGNAIQRLEKEARDDQARLAAMNEKISQAGKNVLTVEQKDQQLADLRKTETEKRLGHERELARVEQVRAARALIERERLEAVRKLEERKAGPQRGEDGRFIKGGSKADLARMDAENAARARAIDSLNQQETAHRANARAMQEEGRAAAQAGDALAKRTLGADASVEALKAEASAIERKLAANAQEIASMRAKSTQEIAQNGQAAQRVAALDAQIAKQRELMSVHTQERATLAARATDAAAALSTSNAQIQAFEREIQTKQRAIAMNADELARLRAATVEKGKYSAATDAKIAALNREIQRETEGIATASKKVQAEREVNAARSEAVQAINKKIAASEGDITTATRSVDSMTKQAAALRAQSTHTDAHTQALERERAALQASLNGTNANIAAKSRLTSVVMSGGSALLGFGKSLLAGVGWALAFGVAIEGATWLIGQFTKKAREAEAAQQALNRAKNGQSVEGDDELNKTAAATNKSELDSTLKKIEQVKKSLADARAAKSVGGSIGGRSSAEIAAAQDAAIKSAEAQLATLEQRAQNLKGKITEYEEGAVKAAKTIAQTKVENTTGSIMQDLERNATKQLNELATFGKNNNQTIGEWNLQNKAELAAELKKGKGADLKLVETLRQEGAEIGRKRIDAEVKILAENRKAIEAAHAHDTAEQKASLKAALDAKAAGLAEMQFNAADSTDAVSKKPKKAYVRPDSTYDNFVQSKKAELAKLQTEATMFEDGIVSVAEIYEAARIKFESAIKSGEMTQTDAKGKKRAITPAEKKVAIDLDAEEQIGKNIDKLRGKLLPALDGLKAEEERYQEVFNGDYLFKPSKEVKQTEKLIQEIMRVKDLLNTPQGESLKKAIDATGMSVEQVVAKLKQMPADIALGEVMNDLNKDVRALADDQVTDDRERERIRTATLIREAQRRVDIRVWELQQTGELGEVQQQHIRDAQGALASYIELQQNRLALVTRSAAEVMADEWSKGMRNLENASASWANKFVDDVFEGKLVFKDFAQSILLDIGKIKFKEVMSEGVGSVLDGAIAGIGEIFGIKGTGAKSNDGMPLNASRSAVMVQLVGGGLPGIDTPMPFPDPTNELGTIFSDFNLGAGQMLDSMDNTMNTVFMGLQSNMDTMFNGLDLGLNGMLSSVGSLLSSAGGSGGDSDMIGSIAGYIGSFFKDGGIMTGAGAISLRKYANGGIANKPQLAMFGEGSRPEAYVPLPDGRRIPVALQGGEEGGGQPGGASAAAAPEVHINLINQSGTQQTAKVGNMKFDGRQMVLDVVLSAVSQPGAFRDNFKSMMDQ